ncbi:hypothetical protein THAOC_01053, partial [Thalassiosira oceanica]
MRVDVLAGLLDQIKTGILDKGLVDPAKLDREEIFRLKDPAVEDPEVWYCLVKRAAAEWALKKVLGEPPKDGKTKGKVKVTESPRRPQGKPESSKGVGAGAVGSSRVQKTRTSP